MVSRGRPNTSKTKAKAKIVTAKTPAKAKAQGQTGKIQTAIGIGSSLLGLTGKGKSGKGGMHKHLSAKLMLKRAYEKRAKRQIRFGNLGQARRTLRKKITVI